MSSSNTQSPFDYDSIPVGYYDKIFRQSRGAQSKWHHLKFARVRRELNPAGRHLDVACGPGTFAGTLPADMPCLGVDIAVPQVEYARTHYGTQQHTFALMQPGQLPVEDQTFDSLTCIELIEHISEPEALRLMQESLRVLRPGGKAVFTTPNYGSLWPLLESVLNRLGEVSYKDQHITRYTRQSLQAALVRSGFTRVRVRTCLFAAPFVAALSWRLADHCAHLEDPLVRCRAGHLLVATAEKS